MELRKLSPFRNIVYYISKRNYTNHATVSIGFAWDITDVISCIDILRNNGEHISLTAFFTKATALLMKKHPRLNSKIYRSFFGKLQEVQFNDIHCSMLVENFDENNNSEVSFRVLRHVDKMPISTISKKIQKQKRKAYKTKMVSPLLLKIIQFRLSNDPESDARSVGTYAMSSMIQNNLGTSGGHGLSPYITYWPMSIEDKIVPHRGTMTTRKILGFGVGFDQYLLDVNEVSCAMADLKKLVEEPHHILYEEFPQLRSLLASFSQEKEKIF